MNKCDLIAQGADMNDDYPVQFSVDYGDGTRSRVTTLFRLIMMIPIVVVLAVVSCSSAVFAAFLMILFRKKYPKWIFDFQLEVLRFNARVSAYISLLTDEYPSTDEEQSVHLDVAYPDASTELNRLMPLIKWLLAIPHYIVLLILEIFVLVVTIVAWFAIIITGKYPEGMFNFVVGVTRWSNRVTAYAFMLATDRYPPFRLSP